MYHRVVIYRKPNHMLEAIYLILSAIFLLIFYSTFVQNKKPDELNSSDSLKNFKIIIFFLVFWIALLSFGSALEHLSYLN